MTHAFGRSGDRRRIDRTNDWGWNLGLGAMGFFNDHFGVRGDVRYLRTFSGNFIDGFD